MKTKFYAGIGSRETPNHIQAKMSEIASILERRGFVLRSGGARGADMAFETGVKNDNKEIYLMTNYISFGRLYDYTLADSDFAKEMVKKYHPSKGKLNSTAFLLHARNTFQIFGTSIRNENSMFVICYTPDGAETTTSTSTGGTGQAIRIANDYGIPVYNLKNYIGLSAEEIVKFILEKEKSHV